MLQNWLGCLGCLEAPRRLPRWPCRLIFATVGINYSRLAVGVGGDGETDIDVACLRNLAQILVLNPE